MLNYIKLAAGGKTRRFVTDCSLSVGDYGGAGAIGAANINALLELAERAAANSPPVTLSFSDLAKSENGTLELDRPFTAWSFEYWSGGQFHVDPETIAELMSADWLEITGDYGSRQLWVAVEWDEGCETVEALEAYPLIDDGFLSQIEMEWAEEAIGDTVADLSIWAYRRGLERISDWIEANLQERWHTVVERLTIDPVMELSGAYWQTDGMEGEIIAAALAMGRKAAK